MDPTNSKGTLFSCKGPQNHQISDQWKECVLREQRIGRGWKEKHGRTIEEQEARLLLASLKLERDWHRRRAQPLQKREGDAKLLYGDGLGRTRYLQKQKEKAPQVKSRRPLTSSQEVGWRGTNAWSSLIERTEFGRKPVVEGSFYRKSGVF
eukprot:TRINITY_DN55100_c0_g1_i1.p3 TRINITY_DN55100_c0_g1~~TRINITY_DN55100_c0_g1_i1.p3  ORF type:complete len:151 (+),score=59.29 TRINITY_DN55100_c0_g1_i1:112-564(+)